jgi:hypothetical protein
MYLLHITLFPGFFHRETVGQNIERLAGKKYFPVSFQTVVLFFCLLPFLWERDVGPALFAKIVLGTSSLI